MDNVFTYIKREEVDYRTKRISLGDGQWMWNMYEHINRSFLMKHSKFFKGSNELGVRPNKNIIRPILNVEYRSEGFDVKDIEPFVTDSDNYHKSFLIRKFHPKWALVNHMDTFIDEVVESYVDYGGAVIKNVGDVRPEVVPLQRFAFVDQRDILSGAKCEKHSYSIDQLLEMKGKWNADKIDMCINQALYAKPNSSGTGTERSNSKSIEVYELHGMFPETWLDETGDEKVYSRQMHIVTYYKGENDSDVGITLFKTKEQKEIYKVVVRDGIYNRALGWGGVEELFDPQVWTNYNIIQIKEMLDVASLMILQTTDPAFAARNKVTDLKKGEIVTTAENQSISQIRIEPINIQQFRNALVEWETSARTTGSAQDSQLGINPASGTPLGTTQLITGQGQGIHEFRQGKIATFMAEVYRDWVLPFMVADMNKGNKFIEELSFDELRDIGERIVDNWTNEQVKQVILKKGTLTQEQVDAFKAVQMELWTKGGTKKFFEVLKNELKGIPMDVMVNIAGKQKYSEKDVTKLSNIFREIIVNPQGFMQAMQIPAIAKTFNEVLEFSGMNQINFGTLPKQSLQFPTTMQNGAGGDSAPATAGSMSGQKLTAK